MTDDIKCSHNQVFRDFFMCIVFGFFGSYCPLQVTIILSFRDPVLESSFKSFIILIYIVLTLETPNLVESVSTL